MKQGYQKTSGLRDKAKAFVSGSNKPTPEELNFLEAYAQAAKGSLTFREMVKTFALDYNRAYRLKKKFTADGILLPRLPGDKVPAKIDALVSYLEKLLEEKTP